MNEYMYKLLSTNRNDRFYVNEYMCKLLSTIRNKLLYICYFIPP